VIDYRILTDKRDFFNASAARNGDQR